MIGAHVIGLCAAMVVAIFGFIAFLAVEHRENDPLYRARRRARINARHRAALRRSR